MYEQRVAANADDDFGVLKLAIVGLFALCGCGLVSPPLRVHPVPGGVVLDVQTLGEYQTSISRIRISDARGKTVWEVKAKGQVPQIHKVGLRCGRNVARVVDAEEYTVLVPAASDAFTLSANNEYTAEVWGVDKLMPGRATFSIGRCQ
jgi:hypothetical protein